MIHAKSHKMCLYTQVCMGLSSPKQAYHLMHKAWPRGLNSADLTDFELCSLNVSCCEIAA